ncbi:hypothetical protein [Alkalihalobacillus pseudalcaliphilus]|uniref:hypothetical protein n=1 Tax=Alkalihalobacillus pseudalcaliphilus TaxID=79884 RepID=UPI00069D11F4|nr:hypothetical protein [Alkalihalobacillus pseudalcaliphilus]
MKSLDELIAEDITDVNSRMDAVETFYLTARLNCRELTSGEIDRINSYVLREDLRYNHADKMTLIEYPVMTARQAERRAKKETSLKAVYDVATDGRRHAPPTRRKRNDYENWSVNQHAKARNKERREQYVSFTKVQPVEKYVIDPQEIVEYLREKYGRKLK